MAKEKWQLESRRTDLEDMIAEERDAEEPNQERIEDLLYELEEVKGEIESIEEVRDYA